MAKVVVVYHSGYGHTKQQAERVFEGVRGVAGVSARLLTSDEASKDLTPLNEADCIVFGCPTYMGGPSGQFKTFLDLCGQVWLKQGWKDKLAAGFTNSGSLSGDKQSTLIALAVNAMQHGMVWVGTGFMSSEEEIKGRKVKVNRIGSYLGAMSQTSQGSRQVDADDLETAEKFGARVATAAVRWVRGRG